jgi:glycosyltransferase involved in cell wall biosynthesis
MRHLLVFNLATDADDPILGFTTRWLNELAKHYDTLDVVTMRAGRLAVSENVAVYSVGKERGVSEAGRAVRFYWILTRLLRRKRYVCCFAHMMPLFAVMGAPLLKAARVPIVLWYVHRQNHRLLRLAERAAWQVVTASLESFPFATPKLRVVGHGIDTTFYAPTSAPAAEPFQVMQVARLSPIKHQETLLAATADLPMRVVLVGAPLNAGDELYAQRLRAQAADPARCLPAQLTGALPPSQIVALAHQSHAAVNLSPPGLFDKAALEAMACGLPTIVASDGFDALLGPHQAALRVAHPNDVDGLRARLQSLMALSDAQRRQIGADLQAQVVQHHSLPALVEQLVALV